MPDTNDTRSLQEKLRSLQGSSQPNLFSQAADELDRLSAFERAFFSALALVRHYAAVTGEMDAMIRKEA
jgi:hypothetical protein